MGEDTILPSASDWKPERTHVEPSVKQRRALEMLRELDQNGDPKTVEVTTSETCSDSFGVWLNYRTAEALERRGLIKIDRQPDGWDVVLVARLDGTPDELHAAIEEEEKDA